MLVVIALLEYVLGRQTDGGSGGNWFVIAAFAIAGLVIALLPTDRRPSRQGGLGFDVGGGAAYLVTFGLFVFAMGVFSVLRGTLFNNLWWVVTVTFLATALGLAIAVLADRAKYESVAKSFVFMPLAISFVGAGIIWRFMYIARDPARTRPA